LSIAFAQVATKLCRVPDNPQTKRYRGRGAVSSPPPRYHKSHTEAFDDGWQRPTDACDESEQTIATRLYAERARTIISKNDSPDICFDRSINPYKGCEHGCVYCFARPTHAWLDLSAGLDFETRIVYKPNAAELLRQRLAHPDYRPDVLALGANTDPYQPAEQTLGLTRELLTVLLETQHPVVVITKSDRILRDLDLLRELAGRSLLGVRISLATRDLDLARKMEPRAPTPRRRLGAIEALANADIPVGVLTAPMIPGLNDHELEALLKAGRDAGAIAANYALLRLPHDLKEIVGDWLNAHFADRAQRVFSLLRQMRGGTLYRSAFGERLRGGGPLADLLERRFQRALREQGLTQKLPEMRRDRFVAPQLPGSQLSLF
jgi:DNA repair photolyase